jgi:phospholipid/cholesterol/gamma-HCH transport system substrate-binding protein
MLLDNFGETSENLKQLSYDLRELELERTVNNLDSTLVTFKNIMASIENGEGSAGKLLNDDQLYNNLEGATLQLEKLLEDFRLNPKRYVHFSIFGKKAQPYSAEDIETEEKDN